MRLYSMKGTCAVAVHIALAHSGLDFDVHILERGDQRSVEYLSINPLGVVPAIELAKGEVLTEATALLALIDRSARTPFGPPQAELRDFRLAELLSFLSSEVHAAFAPHFAPRKFVAHADAIEEVRETAYRRIGRLLDLLNARIAGTFYFGDRMSVADPYIFVIGRWLDGTPLSLSTFPVLAHLVEAMENDASIKKVLELYD